MKSPFFILLLLSVYFSGLIAQDGLIIQENTLGVCTMDGIIEVSAEGYTGVGYANIDNGVGIGMSWSILTDAEGDYPIYCRYALGGSDITSRDSKVLVNNLPTEDSLFFPHSGSSSWAEWVYTDTILVHLKQGYNKINLLSITEKGLPNIDYFHILGEEIVATSCIPSFSFGIDLNDADAGTVDYSPKQELYDLGTEITVTATENSGYFLHSWSGEGAGTGLEHSFNIQENTELEGLFYPEGTEADPEAAGYATVQHDNGTPYLINGGALGNTVQASNLSELKTFLAADFPLVVELSGPVIGENSEEIVISSDKTLLGIGENARIEGIPVQINGARNIIIKNITFSKVIRYDELEINGGAQNIWIDHCDFYTDQDHNVDYYDGLLDIKNKSRFITISWTKFHDHHKSILISSGDQEIQDSVIRVTFHHNFFYDCGSRLPSIRFGKAHLFNNYYRDNGTAINTRMDACVRVERNYFDNSGTAVGMLYSPIPGAVQLIDNVFINSGYSEEPTCVLDVPYEYSSILHPVDQVPDTVIAGTGWEPDLIPTSYLGNRIKIYPNPSQGIVYLEASGDLLTIQEIKLINASGALVYKSTGEPAGNRIQIPDPEAGIYILQLHCDKGIIRKALIIQ